MHEHSYDFIEQAVASLPPCRSVVELGSRNINGSVRPLFLDAQEYYGVDLVPGAGVDVVADAATWQPPVPVDTVVTTSMLEHTPDGERILKNAYAMLVEGGVLLLHAQCDPWPPHSSLDGGALRQGEYYGNVDPQQLWSWLDAAGFSVQSLKTHPIGDVYVIASVPFVEVAAEGRYRGANLPAQAPWQRKRVRRPA